MIAYEHGVTASLPGRASVSQGKDFVGYTVLTRLRPPLTPWMGVVTNAGSWRAANQIRPLGQCTPISQRDAAVVNVIAFSKILDCLDREVWLITARAGDRCSGLIATFVSSASLVPALPRVMVGLAKHHYTHELIQESNAFCMHLIDEEQIDWVWRFGNQSGREVDKLSGLQTSSSAGGSPILAGALAWLDCRVESKMDTGDRTVFLAEVLDARLERTAAPLTFKRLIELAAPDMVRQMKIAVDRDINSDCAAILKWRQLRRNGDEK